MRLAFACLVLGACVALADDSPIPQPWPPQVGETYPELELKNHKGETVKLSDFRGKVIIVEPIGMNCPACQALAGGNTKLGPFGNNRPQAGLKSFDEYLEEFGQLKPTDRKIVYVQLLLYDMTNANAPTQEEVAKWAEHFKMDGRKNGVVLFGDSRYVNPASFKMIPGFHLIDKNFVLRSDASGHHPKNPMGELFQMIKPLTKEKKSKKKKK